MKDVSKLFLTSSWINACITWNRSWEKLVVLLEREKIDFLTVQAFYLRLYKEQFTISCVLFFHLFLDQQEK